jgi:hypothetical protein
LRFSGGAGLINACEQADADHYAIVSRTDTASGARMSFLVPELKLLCVAVPKSGSRVADLRLYALP